MGKLETMIQEAERKEKEKEERKEKEKGEEERKEKETVDEEDYRVSVTPPVRKILSRTSSFEVIRSKTIIVEDGNRTLERTTLNIQRTPKENPTIEMKIKVISPPPRPAQRDPWRKEEEEEEETTWEEDEEDGPPGFSIEQTDGSSDNIPLSILPTKHSKEDTSSNYSLSPTLVIQKPPLPRRSSSSTPEVNGVQDTRYNGTLSRSNSIGTQTPKIKARTQVEKLKQELSVRSENDSCVVDLVDSP